MEGINFRKLEKETGIKMHRIEELAQQANYANSFTDYKPGSATDEITRQLEGAKAEAEQAIKSAQTQKQKDDITAKLKRYESELIAYYSDYYSNEAACPSVMVAGPANFPVNKKARQNARRETLQEEYNRLEELRRSFKSGLNVISSADPEAIEAIEAKIAQLKASHATKIKANAYFRAHKTLIGFPDMSEGAARNWQTLHDDTSSNGGYWYRVPFMEYNLANENAEIKRLEGRLATIKQQKESTLTGWDFNGGHVVIDNENARIGIYWDDKKRGSDLEELYDKNGDRFNVPRLLWSPRFKRWQCFISPHNIEGLKRSNTYRANDEKSQTENKAIDDFKTELKKSIENDGKESRFNIQGDYKHTDVLNRFGFKSFYKRETKIGMAKHPTATTIVNVDCENWHIEEGKIQEAADALKEYNNQNIKTGGEIDADGQI
jgi:hypothetical protein